MGWMLWVYIAPRVFSGIGAEPHEPVSSAGAPRTIRFRPQPYRKLKQKRFFMAESPITPRSRDFAAWYQDVVLQGDMAEPAEIVKGCMVIKPNGYAVWEVLQRELDARFKALGHQNVYFPLLIPQSFLHKEAEHVEGFSP
ncbi:MAG TPA: hypothetical protein VG672_01080, partial [Bryobacteraceae bacterium]|nr:hypothetical protein [Bryobacteraceae bacterium]